MPPERLREVGAHYFLFGGVSPIHAACRTLVAALENELLAKGPRLPVYWGNRNWHSMLEDTVRRMVDDGVRRAGAVAYGYNIPSVDTSANRRGKTRHSTRHS